MLKLYRNPSGPDRKISSENQASFLINQPDLHFIQIIVLNILAIFDFIRKVKIVGYL